MARVDFNSIQQTNNNSNGQRTGVGFFSLVNDGDSAIVRFMHDDVSTFDILSVHPERVAGKFRNINCIRNAKDPINACPLCARGDELRNKIYLHMMVYTKDENGNIVGEPKVWERTLAYATKLKEYIENYGPMSDVICKITRHGAKGSMQTTYEIIPNLNKQIYTDALYPKDTNAFDNYTALGKAVMDKNYNDLNCFVNIGDFPATTPNANDSIAAANTPTPAPTPMDAITNDIPFGGERAPWENPTPNNTIDRPVRYY